VGDALSNQPVFEVSAAWKAAYPDAHAGALVMRGVSNPRQHAGLEARKQALEADLRERFAGSDRDAIKALPAIEAYQAHYRRFDKSYHVQLQLESIVFKGKSLPNVAALVEAMFMAEVSNMLLTAGHDLNALRLPVMLDVASGSERYTLLRGDEQATKAGDMLMADREGVVSSILYGPDKRTSITPETRDVMFTVYAPVGITPDAVIHHLEDIQQNVLIVSPGASTEMLRVFGAEG
jgi:DNA/RNA-binding domain of Phe-tRNA-synthetase-like protein